MKARDIFGAALVATTLLTAPLMAAQPSFPTPEAAAAALVTALASPDEAALVALLGPENGPALIGGDPASRRVELRRMAAAAAEGLALRETGPEGRILLLGRQAWPMPVPLVREAAGWRFDTATGLEVIIDRRIGGNELAAIDSLGAYVDAQQLYATLDHDGDQVLEYAQRIESSPGKEDGLYWPPRADGVESPLGPLLAAAGEIAVERQQGEPFFGYVFKILTGQGANPPGGAYGYVINGNMIAGFAMIAWPADYGNSGIMTLAVSHQGQIFQKDLGADTARLAAAITAYDPDTTWTLADSE